MTTSAFVYIDELLDNKVPIYVRNIYKTRGIVSVTFSDGHKEVIPNTKFPVCLSSRATPDMIRNSRCLRQMLDHGVLELVDYKVAEEELSDPDIRNALEDAYARISNSSTDVLAHRTAKSSDPDSPKPSDATDKANSFSRDVEFVGEEDPDEETAGVADRVLTLVESFNNKDIKSRQVKSELLSLDLSSEDLSYLIDNTTGIVQRYAKEKFAEAQSHGGTVDV